VFVAAFTAIGAARSGYDWRRHAVSSLACGRRGWWQRANFILAGILWCAAARGLAQAPRRVVGPPIIPALVGAAGVGLVGSGLFVTDPVGGFPPPNAPAAEARNDEAPDPPRTWEGKLHNLSVIPIFAGIPVAGLAAAVAAARARDYRWAGYSASSSVAIVGSFVLFGAAFGGKDNLSRSAGIFQRLSIAAGVGWVTALSCRTLRALQQR
jgi:Protein of unknown function (DUF998)